MRITIIGAGNMGGAAAIGLSEAGETIRVTARHASTLEKFKNKGIETSTDNTAAIKDADLVVIAVKPWVVKEVVCQIAPHIDFSRQTIISFAPGINPEDLIRMFHDAVPECRPSIAYVIPNTAIEISRSMTFIAPVSCTDAQTGMIEDCFAKVGMVKTVAVDKLSAGTALASCGIAYALRYIRAAAEAGVEFGFYPKDAIEIVSQTVLGAASILNAHGSHPEMEIDKVTTPGGLTIKGLNAMEEAGFTNAVIKGLKAGR